MTISAVRTSSKSSGVPRHRAGMTLLEVVIAMSLLVLLLGLGAVSYASSHDERVLREATAYIESMASRGHAMSVLHQKPFWLQFEQGTVRLVGADTRPEAQEEEGPFASWRSFEEKQEERQSVVVYDQYSTDVEVSIRRWGANENVWNVPDEENSLIWQFQATGLCEPLSLRFSHKDNWIVLYMHPLTARAVDEEMHIQ